MIKYLLVAFWFFGNLFCNQCIAQNFPYLNNSSCNEREYVSDSDYNRILYKKNRIIKLDYYYDFVWAKEYMGLTFKRLLASKTGAIYFIARHDSSSYIHNYFGKINADGNIDWCKAIPTSSLGDSYCDLEMMQLDRNNDLVLTTSFNGIFLKADTLGNLLKVRRIDNSGWNELANLTLISDSAGIYTFFGYGISFQGYGGAIINYSDVNDNDISSYQFSNYYGQVGTGYNGQGDYKIFKSRNSPSDFYLFVRVAPPSWQTDVTLDVFKFSGNKFLWKCKIDNINIEGVEEDYLKNLCVLGSKKSQFTSHKDVFIYRFDSLGNMENYKYDYLTLFGSYSVDSLAKDSLFNISTISGQMFYSSILTHDFLRISRFVFFPGYECMSDQNISFNYIPGSTTMLPQAPNSFSFFNLPSVALVDSSSITVTDVPLLVTKEDCWLVTNLDDPEGSKEGMEVFPNPSNKYLSIKTSFSITNKDEYSVVINDLLGKRVLSIPYQEKIDISLLESGIYIFQFFNREKLVSTKKIIVQK